MANNGKGALVGTLLVLGLISYACGKDDTPSATPIPQQPTVISVETFADLTLSDGRKVHNTSVDGIASMVTPDSGASAEYQAQTSCTTQALNRFAAANLVGRPVNRVDVSTSSYTTAPLPGYTPAALSFVDGSSSYYDFTSALGDVRSTAATSCYAPPSYSTPAPAASTPTTSEAPVTSEQSAPEAYVDTPDVAPLDRHTGHSGHPCRPKERDGDGDGYCGEGK